MMSGYLGMGDTLANAVQRQFGIGGGRGRGGDGPEDDDPEHKLLESGLGDQVEGRLAAMYDQVEVLIREHRLEVLAGAMHSRRIVRSRVRT